MTRSFGGLSCRSSTGSISASPASSAPAFTSSRPPVGSSRSTPTICCIGHNQGLPDRRGGTMPLVLGGLGGVFFLFGRGVLGLFGGRGGVDSQLGLWL